MIFENIKHGGNTLGNLNKFVMVCVIMLFVLAGWVGNQEGELKTYRRDFCLERGYDGYKMTGAGEKFYCWNTVNGEIKRFRDSVP